jgi:hypothetical protein
MIFNVYTIIKKLFPNARLKSDDEWQEVYYDNENTISYIKKTTCFHFSNKDNTLITINFTLDKEETIIGISASIKHELSEMKFSDINHNKDWVDFAKTLLLSQNYKDFAKKIECI